MDDEWVPVQRRALFKCDGSGHTSGSIAQGCGRLVMEGGVQQHLGEPPSARVWYRVSNQLTAACDQPIARALHGWRRKSSHRACQFRSAI